MRGIEELTKGMDNDAMQHGLVHQHDPALVIVAAVVCVAGGWATSRFFGRLTEVGGAQRSSWLFLTALASGVTIWCTHFIAMLGYHTGGPAALDIGLTAVSLLVAVLGSAVGFLLASGDPRPRVWPALGGAVVGLSIGAMHYIGMRAFLTDGTISWNSARVALSVGFAVVLSTAALQAARSRRRHAGNLMWLLFVLSVLLLHFTGVSAMSVMTSPAAGERTGSASFDLLAMGIAAMSFVTIGAGAAGYFIDDRSRAAAVERFRHLALTDVLTGLPNRASFNERLRADIERARKTGSRLAMVVVDVNDFKEINDLRGHAIGDEVLSTLGHRMGALTQGSADAFIARVGGDEFVATYRFDERRALIAFLTELCQALSATVDLETGDLAPSASVGVAVFPDDALDEEELVNNADLAMYRAKGSATDEICFYDADVDERTRVRRGLASDLQTVVTLRVIKAAQRLGFTLDEVADLIETGPRRNRDSGMQARAAEMLVEVEARIEDLTLIRANLQTAIAAGRDDLHRCASSDCCPSPFVDLAQVTAPE
jgi:diguanylate cyclase (GGDEF)-like protein